MRRALLLATVLLVVGPGVPACSRRQPQQGQAPANTSTSAVAGATDIRLPDDAGGWTAAGPPTTYDQETIYSYIDGQAEVYRAYGFKRCVSRRFAGPAGESDIVADVFELASPEDAFGIYTHDRDGAPAGVGNDSLVRYGWLSFWQGPYFVSIVAEGDTERSRAALLELGRAMATALPAGGQRPPIVGDLPARDLDPRSVRFLRHPQILNTHVFVSDDNVFGLAPDTGAALGGYRRGSDRAHLILIEYPDEERANAAATSARKGLLNGSTADAPVVGTDGGFFAVRVSGRRIAAVLGATSAGFALELLNAASPSK